jgi:hypothetical protein
MLTLAQRNLFTKAFDAASAALTAIPHQQELAKKLVKKCAGTNPEARAVWWLASYLGKPSRIPSFFGSLLDMDEDTAYAAAIVSKYSAELHAALPQRTIDRILQVDLYDTL